MSYFEKLCHAVSSNPIDTSSFDLMEISELYVATYVWKNVSQYILF